MLIILDEMSGINSLATEKLMGKFFKNIMNLTKSIIFLIMKIVFQIQIIVLIQ